MSPRRVGARELLLLPVLAGVLQRSAGQMCPSLHRGGVHVPAARHPQLSATRPLFLLSLLASLAPSTAIGNRLHRQPTDYTAERVGGALDAEHQRVVGEAYDGAQLSLPTASAISVVEFGADRSASADSATAFQRALAAAAVSNDTRTVYVPPGHYKFRAT